MTILGRKGAEQLLGKGDMLFYRDGLIERLQAPLTTAQDVLGRRAMNDRGASAALQAIAAGDDSKLDELCSVAVASRRIAGRYLAGDLREAAGALPPHAGDGGLSSLLSGPGGPARQRARRVLPGLASARSLRASRRADRPRRRAGIRRSVRERARRLARGRRHARCARSPPAQGRLGAIRTAAWLQTVSGR